MDKKLNLYINKMNKQNVKIQIKHPGTLIKYGYHINDLQKNRRHAILNSLINEGYNNTMKRLNTLYVFNKYNEHISYKLQKDKKYLIKLSELLLNNIIKNLNLKYI
jgi:hypothetical protein